MSGHTSPWLALAATSIVVGSAAACYCLVATDSSPWRRMFNRYAARLDRHTSFCLDRVTGAQIAGAQVALVCMLATAAVVLRSWVVVVGAVGAAVGPPAVLFRRHARRRRRIEQQLDGWLLMLANSLKATSATTDAMVSTLAFVEDPIGQEVDIAVKEMRLGATVRRALSTMASRIDSPLVSGALTTVIVASETGGELPAILERTAESLRESARLEGVLRAKTAEGRGQLVLLVSMPFVLVSAIRWLDPSYFDPVVSETSGQMIAAICVALWLGASGWAYQIVTASR